jgi:hypothetical protein
MGISFNEDHTVRLYWQFRTTAYLNSDNRCFLESSGGMAINNRKLKYFEKQFPPVPASPTQVPCGLL